MKTSMTRVIAGAAIAAAAFSISSPALAIGKTEKGTERGFAICMAVLNKRIADAKAVQDPPPEVVVKANCVDQGNGVYYWEIWRGPLG